MNWREKTVAVTGAAGFLGSHLCDSLVERGADVRAFDNFSVGSAENFGQIRDEIEVVDCDVRDRGSLETIGDADIVYHLAAIANPRTCEGDFDLAFDVNVNGTKNVLEACRENDCERVVFVSTASVYGDPEYVPIDESHPQNGEDPYAITKKMGENLCRNYYRNYDLPVTIVRNFNLFGPRQKSGYLVPTLIRQAIDEGRIEIWNSDSVRDFTYVDNGVEALLEVPQCDGLFGDVVNVGSGTEVSAGELAERISRSFGHVPIEDLDKDTVGSSRLVCDNEKLRETTDWAVDVPFESGIETTVGWFQRHS